MLEKIFGKKSTAVVYIVCASFLLLMLAGNILMFLRDRSEQPLYSLILHAIVTAVALAIITAPILIQKKFRLYIPPAIEVGICFYTFLSFVHSLPTPQSEIQTSVSITIDLTPIIGGFILAMSIFTVLYSLLDVRAEKKERRLSLSAVTALTVAALFATALVFTAVVWIVSFFLPESVSPQGFAVQTAYYLGGGILFCIVGCLAARSHGDRFRIRSFKNPDTAKQLALKTENKTLYTVVENVSSDTTDYKKALCRAKAQFFLLRIVYLVVYGAYVVHTCIVFSRLHWGTALIIFLCSSFLLTACVYIYEYLLYRKNIRNQRLRKLKIAKNVARIYSLALILAAMFFSDYAYKPISAALSEGMILFNFCLFFYNIFGKPKNYPSGEGLRSAEKDGAALSRPADADNRQNACIAAQTARAGGADGTDPKTANRRTGNGEENSGEKCGVENIEPQNGGDPA